MALIWTKIYLANSKYRWDIDGKTYCWWEADVFNIEKQKSSIMYDMLSYINDWEQWLIYQHWLVAIITNKDNEDYNHIRIYPYYKDYSEEDYINNAKHLKEYWFGFIANNLITI